MQATRATSHRSKVQRNIIMKHWGAGNEIPERARDLPQKHTNVKSL